MEIRKKIEAEKERILKIKSFFEERSFEGSQFWKWVQEFGELEQEIKNFIGNGTKDSLEKLVDEIADELITRAQTEIKEEDFLKKLKLEKWEIVYKDVCSALKDRIIKRIDFKLNRTEERIKKRFYEQYN